MLQKQKHNMNTFIDVHFEIKNKMKCMHSELAKHNLSKVQITIALLQKQKSNTIVHNFLCQKSKLAEMHLQLYS